MTTATKCFIIVFVLALVVTLDSCTKVRESNLIKGLWQIDGIYIDTIQTNQLNNLEHYTDGNNCCNYRIDFQDNGVVFGYYLTYDTFSFVTYGTWDLPDYDHLDIKLGNYLDGNFKITKTSPTHFKFVSPVNHVPAYDGINPRLDTCATRIEMSKQ